MSPEAPAHLAQPSSNGPAAAAAINSGHHNHRELIRQRGRAAKARPPARSKHHEALDNLARSLVADRGRVLFCLEKNISRKINSRSRRSRQRRFSSPKQIHQGRDTGDGFECFIPTERDAIDRRPKGRAHDVYFHDRADKPSDRH